MTTNQTLEFLTFTPDHAHAHAESRRLVRSHAIRDAIRRRRVQAAPGYKQLPVKKVVEVSRPLSEHTGRFRLNATPKSTAKTNAVVVGRKRKNAGKKDERKEDEKEVVVKQQQNGNTNRSLVLDSLWHQRQSPVSELSVSTSLSPSTSTSTLDPFDILPVKYGHRYKALHLYNSAVYRTNSFAFYPNKLFVSYAATDSAWLSATLSLIKLYYDLKTGSEVSQECLFHRGEALRIVNERLSASPEVISDGTIGAVAALANFDTINGSHRSAATHFQGLLQMVSSRGGILALEQNTLLQKTIGWADLCYSSAIERIPRFPIVESKTCIGTLESLLGDIASWYPLNNIYSPIDLVGEMTQIFQSMRFLSFLLDNPSQLTTADQELFTRGAYIVGYRLVTVLDSGPDTDEAIFRDRSSHVYGSCRLAAHLYLYIALREVPRGAEISRTITDRLCGILKTVTGDVLIVWQDDMFLLLWIAFMGASATLIERNRVFLVDLLARTTARMGIGSLEEFRSALKRVLWVNEYCALQSAVVWADVVRTLDQRVKEIGDGET